MRDLHRDLTPMTQEEKLEKMFGPFLGPARLNIGCAGNKLDGWVNLDKDPRAEPDVVADITVRAPFDVRRFDTILASHVLEHIPKQDLFKVFANLWLMLKSGGHLICIVPYGSSDDAWDNPHHHQLFTENTFAYFSSRLYEQGNSAGYKAYEGQEYCDWQIALQSLVPYPEYSQWKPDMLNDAKHRFRNVIQELHVVMKAVK